MKINKIEQSNKKIILAHCGSEEALIFGPDDESYCNAQVMLNSKPIILYSDLIMNQRWKENPNLLIRRVNGDDSIPPT